MVDIKAIPAAMKTFWQKEQVYEQLLARKGKPYRVLEGPPYANGEPHAGHLKNTVFKDIAIRLAWMRGYQVAFQPGFDTHGLPIENMVEKKLGLRGKKDIATYGVGKFMQACKDNATLNKDAWMRVYEQLGSVYTLKDPYVTYDNSYIESGWWMFAQMYAKKLVYHGEKPVLWCSQCETSLAGYEVTDSYKDLQDPGVYLLFKLVNDDRSMLVYTTTPWTLPANVALAVAPQEMYVTVELEGKKIILAEARLPLLDTLGKKYRVLTKCLGKTLVGTQYEPLLDVPLQRSLPAEKAHVIVASIPLLKERVSSKVAAKKGVTQGDVFEEFVTVSEGTGVVHVAPGHGKTDYLVGQHYHLACVSPVDERGMFTSAAGFTGFVKKANTEISAYLEKEGRLLYQQVITHSYPVCWRCKTPLIFRLSNQLFLKVAPVKKIIQKVNTKVTWLPAFARERFNTWVANAEDWNISRQRFWGIPIPLWQCTCGKEVVVASQKELEQKTKQTITDLHVVDHLTFPCSCGKPMKRIGSIFDVWFDSGIVPGASVGYPHDNKKFFEEHFPVDRINEAQDQIRGWFYSLMFCSAAVFGKAPYKTVSMVGWVLDKKGDKMSKSAGNFVSGDDALAQLGPDVLRYYFCWDCAPYDIQKFNAESAQKEVGKIFTILANLLNLSQQGKVMRTEPEDAWILSRLESVTQAYTGGIDSFELHTALHTLSDFIVQDLSRTYIQMTRDREQGALVGVCLARISQLLAPVSPFFAEYLWQALREKQIVADTSVHLTSWPTVQKKIINEKIEQTFTQVQKILEVGLRKRDQAHIGLKWPLALATITSEASVSKEVHGLIMKQLNVKKIKIVKGKEFDVVLDTVLTPALEAEGYARELARALQAARKDAGLQKGDMITTTVFVSSELQKMLHEHLGFLTERTNSKKLLFSDEQNAPAEAIVLTVRERRIVFSFRRC